MTKIILALTIIATIQSSIDFQPLLLFSQEENEGATTKESREYVFELPLSGSTGYATVETYVYSTRDNEDLLCMLNGGEAFCILEEQGDEWKISVNGQEGWLNYEYCLVNLPDLMPSMIYDNANSYASVMQSMGKEIPNITGQKLYDAEFFNERLGEMYFAMPIMYETAKKLAQAQKLALADGNTLVIVETYRPFSTQMKMVDNMCRLLETEPEIEASLMTWGLSYFIATNISNHQRGIAVDLTLAKVLGTETRTTGEYSYEVVSAYEEYEMPTAIHDLNLDATSMAYPVPSTYPWEEVPLSKNMNQWSIILRDYCTTVGFSPLSSEWWHFNDYTIGLHSDNVGRYFLDELVSVSPLADE